MDETGYGGRRAVQSRDGVVASAHPLASGAGVAILHAGGNAFDAAVAVAAALNVVEPFMSGLAGMGFATAWVEAEARVRVLDFVPPVPRSFPVERFQSRAQVARGPLSVGLPGNLAGWCALRAAYGRLPLDKVLAPAIALAEEGFSLERFGAEEIGHEAPILGADPVYGDAFRANYGCSQGAALGDVLRQAPLAATLRQIAADGPQTLYGGELGRRLASHMAAIGGTLTEADLHDVEAVWRDPISITYRGLRVHTPPPPCEGFQFLLTLRILEGFDVAALGPNTLGHLDLIIRAIRLAAGVRIANNDPSADALAHILSDGHVADLQARLRAGGGLVGPTEQWTAEPPPGEDPGHTTSLSIGDREGNLVCITQSLGSPFGSGVVVPGTGVCLNNFIYWADVQSGSPNRTAPGRRLPMCMSPSLSTRDGVAELALGTPGSYGIMQTQPQAMVQHVDFGRDLQQAIEAPRARLWDGRAVELEDRIAPEVIAGLRGLGHDAYASGASWTKRVGGMQAVRRDAETGWLTGAADPRRDGRAVAA